VTYHHHTANYSGITHCTFKTQTQQFDKGANCASFTAMLAATSNWATIRLTDRTACVMGREGAS